jgi:hypothetical protein
MDKVFELKITWRDAAMLICAGVMRFNSQDRKNE